MKGGAGVGRDDHASSRRKRRSQLEGGSSGGKAKQRKATVDFDGSAARRAGSPTTGSESEGGCSARIAAADSEARVGPHTRWGFAAAAAAAKPRSKNGETAGQAARSVGHSRNEPASQPASQPHAAPGCAGAGASVAAQPAQHISAQLSTAQHSSARISPPKAPHPSWVDCHSSSFARLAPRPLIPSLGRARPPSCSAPPVAQQRVEISRGAAPFRVALSGSAWLGLLELCPNDSGAAATALHPLSYRTQSQSRFA